MKLPQESVDQKREYIDGYGNVSVIFAKSPIYLDGEARFVGVRTDGTVFRYNSEGQMMGMDRTCIKDDLVSEYHEPRTLEEVAKDMAKAIKTNQFVTSYSQNNGVNGGWSGNRNFANSCTFEEGSERCSELLKEYEAIVNTGSSKLACDDIRGGADES